MALWRGQNYPHYTAEETSFQAFYNFLEPQNYVARAGIWNQICLTLKIWFFSTILEYIIVYLDNMYTFITW